MPPDPPRVLLQKARDDERLAKLVSANPNITDEQIGFLAQQAVEKALKAVLSIRGVRYRRTHDLGELLDLLKATGITHPQELNTAVSLTPFAAEMRYDYLPPEANSDDRFERDEVLALVGIALAWAENILSHPPSTS